MGKQSFSSPGMSEIILALGFLILFFVSVSRSNRRQCTCCTRAHSHQRPIISCTPYSQSVDLISTLTVPNQNFTLPNLLHAAMQLKV